MPDGVDSLTAETFGTGEMPEGEIVHIHCIGTGGQAHQKSEDQQYACSYMFHSQVSLNVIHKHNKTLYNIHYLCGTYI